MRNRNNFSKDQITNHLLNQRRSGQSLVSYCAEQELCKSTFYRWRRVYSEALQVSQKEFIELIPPVVQSRNSLVEIELPSSLIIRFYQGANSARVMDGSMLICSAFLRMG